MSFIHCGIFSDILSLCSSSATHKFLYFSSSFQLYVYWAFSVYHSCLDLSFSFPYLCFSPAFSSPLSSWLQCAVLSLHFIFKDYISYFLKSHSHLNFLAFFESLILPHIFYSLKLNSLHSIFYNFKVWCIWRPNSAFAVCFISYHFNDMLPSLCV